MSNSKPLFEPNLDQIRSMDFDTLTGLTDDERAKVIDILNKAQRKNALKFAIRGFVLLLLDCMFFAVAWCIDEAFVMAFPEIKLTPENPWPFKLIFMTIVLSFAVGLRGFHAYRNAWETIYALIHQDVYIPKDSKV